ALAPTCPFAPRNWYLATEFVFVNYEEDQVLFTTIGCDVPPALRAGGTSQWRSNRTQRLPVASTSSPFCRHIGDRKLGDVVSNKIARKIKALDPEDPFAKHFLVSCPLGQCLYPFLMVPCDLSPPHMLRRPVTVDMNPPEYGRSNSLGALRRIQERLPADWVDERRCYP